MTLTASKPLAVVAVGGNSLIRDEQHRTVRDQYEAASGTITHVLDLLEQGYRVVLTHGNGPQVGFILLRSELSRSTLHPVPLDSCVADTQGAIGYQFQMAIQNEAQRRGQRVRAATVVTQVLVDAQDPGMLAPSKPIGPFYSAEEAEERRLHDGWAVMEDAGRGWRRVVASPKPMEILEEDAVRALADEGFLVVAVGGGGIPVVRTATGELEGVAAVIDKDLASALLASRLGAELFVVSTAVPQVYLDFGKPSQRALERVTLAELEGYMGEGHFKPGSMLPKVKAVADFLRRGGREAIITSPDQLAEAVAGRAGTHIIP